MRVLHELMLKLEVRILKFHEESDVDSGCSRTCDFGNFLDFGAGFLMYTHIHTHVHTHTHIHMSTGRNQKVNQSDSVRRKQMSGAGRVFLVL